MHAADTTGIVVVTQVQPISVIFTLPEESLGAVGAALAAGPVPVTTLSRDGGKELDRGTIKLKARFANEHNTLWPGQYVTAQVLIRTDRNVLLLPAGAVQIGPDGPFTYVVKPDMTVEVRPLKIAESDGAMTAVTAGVEVDERVVTSNQYRLQPGARVRIAAAAERKP